LGVEGLVVITWVVGAVLELLFSTHLFNLMMGFTFIILDEEGIFPTTKAMGLVELEPA
jgi:hypothetical protein